MANLDELEEFQEYLENKYSEILVDGVLKSKKNVGMNEYERFQEQQKQAVIFSNMKSFMAVEEQGTPYKCQTRMAIQEHGTPYKYQTKMAIQEHGTPYKYKSKWVETPKPTESSNPYPYEYEYSNQYANITNMEEYKTPCKYNSTFVKPQKPYKLPKQYPTITLMACLEHGRAYLDSRQFNDKK